MDTKSPRIVSWHHQTVSDVLSAFSTSPQGLAAATARERLKEYGPNALPQRPPRSAWAIFFAQFRGPLMLILIAAAGISSYLQELIDVVVILAAVLLNVALGFFEEFKADRSLQKLKEFLPQEVRVRREGRTMTVPAADVVPGDLMLLATGDKVTADGRVLQAQQLEANEAPLTGESLSVKKQVQPVAVGAQPADQTSMVFAGTIVVHGRAEVIVTGTGLNTEIGRITNLVLTAQEEQTPLQKQLSQFAKMLSGLIVLLASAIFLFGLARGFDPTEMFRVSVALAVSAIPEGLAVGVTVILAIGMQRILKQKALVRRLIAAETLGSVSVICADKTGTLTTGVMTVDEIRIQGRKVELDGTNNQELDVLRRAIALTHAAQREQDPKTGEKNFTGSPTETALARYVEPYASAFTRAQNELLAELPFDSAVKFSARSYRAKSGADVFVMGAPEVLMARASLSDREVQRTNETIAAMAKDGLRVLLVGVIRGVARASELQAGDVHDLTVLGLVGLRDPLREEAARAIALAREAGLRPVMITGDHPETARVIAAKVGLDVARDGVMTGVELEDLDDILLRERVDQVHVFARVMPGHKLRIIKAWQARGHSVAMTGDGVNDAPAIKVADIGIALGSGTEVAKETADMVLLDNNFRTIVMAIREGRIIFDNMRKLIVYLLASSFSEIVLVLGAVIFSLPLPLLPVQILWINLATDSLPAAALTFEPGEKGIMREKPRARHRKLVDREMKLLIFIVGIVTDAVLFGVYLLLLSRALPIEEIRSFLFATLGFGSLSYIFAVRTFRTSAFAMNPFRNPYLIGGVAFGIVLQILPFAVAPMRELFGLVPLSLEDWAFICLLAMVKLVAIEAAKVLMRRTGRIDRSPFSTAPNAV